MRVAVIDCGSGNLASAARALEEAAARRGVAAEVAVTASPALVASADRIVLPGQGAFAACARGLDAVSGLRDAIGAAVGAGKPFLGICVGMQLMAEFGYEHARTEGFGWIRGEVRPLAAPGLRLPHMGWNALDIAAQHPLFAGVNDGEHVYFVHSFALYPVDDGDVIARTAYGEPVVAAVARDHLAGTQFHVEKSGEVGLRILGNFLLWSPRGVSA